MVLRIGDTAVTAGRRMMWWLALARTKGYELRDLTSSGSTDCCIRKRCAWRVLLCQFFRNFVIYLRDT